MVKPFYKNLRKELTKMPKGYFLDLGLRNFFISNFKPFEMREDKGVLLENAVFRHLLETYSDDEIRFWRTIQKNEVDFIVAGRQSFEVKINPHQLKKNSYKVFLKNYPDISFSLVSIEKKCESVGSFKVLNVWEL